MNFPMKQYDGGCVRTYPYKQPELWDWREIGKFGRSQREWSQRTEAAGKVVGKDEAARKKSRSKGTKPDLQRERTG